MIFLQSLISTVKKHHVIKGRKTEVKKALAKQEMDSHKRKGDNRHKPGQRPGPDSRGAPVWESGPYNSGFGGGYGNQGGCKIILFHLLFISLYN